MSLPQLTASRLELAHKCPASHAHEHTQITNQAAQRGTAIHSYIAATLRGDHPSYPDEDPEAASVCARLNKERLRRIAAPSGGPLHVEIGLYYRKVNELEDAGVLAAEGHRDYSNAPEGSIVGTADAVSVAPGCVVVTDWKSGGYRVEEPAENWQLRFLALASARSFGFDAARVQIARIHEDGFVSVRAAELTAKDLLEVAARLAALKERVALGREGDPEYRPGPHCRLCPAFSRCPAMAGAAQALMDEPVEELTPRKASEVFERLQAVEAATKRVRAALLEYVYARPVPTEGGKELKVLENRRESIDSSKALATLRRYLPDDETLAQAISITKSSLSGALDKEAQKEVIAALKEAGAISESYTGPPRG